MEDLIMTLVKKNQDWLPSIFNDLFDDKWLTRTATTTPAVNIKESKQNYTIEVAAPGLTKEDFKVYVDEDNVLVIKVEKHEEKKEEKSDEHFLRHEFSYSTFQQALILPDDVDKKNIAAKAHHGVLKITLPRLSEVEVKKTQQIIEIC